MHPLAQKLSSLRRQLVLRQRAAAACWTAATLLAAAIALGTADYLVRFADPGLRIMATFALVSAALWAMYRWWYVPSRNQLAPLAVARRVEAHFPQLRDMLASSMEFLEQSEDDRTAGSAQLRRLVVAEAQSAVERLPLDDVIDRGPLRRAVRWLAAPVIVADCLTGLRCQRSGHRRNETRCAVGFHAVAAHKSPGVSQCTDSAWRRDKHLRSNLSTRPVRFRTMCASNTAWPTGQAANRRMSQ